MVELAVGDGGIQTGDIRREISDGFKAENLD
jgi:hypothetical protein